MHFSSNNYFEIFSVPEAFQLDLSNLTDQYRRLQAQVHPDRFAGFDRAKQRCQCRIDRRDEVIAIFITNHDHVECLMRRHDVPACTLDEVAAVGMRRLARPRGNDPAIISGESGAVGIGLICRLAADNRLAGIKEQMNLNPASVVLCFSTEGDTDPDNYRAIVKGR